MRISDWSSDVCSSDLPVEARSDRPERLSLIVPGEERPVAPTNWSFGQLCSLVSAPASYLRELPAALAGINLQHGLVAHRAEQVKLYQTHDGRTALRARSEENTSELQSLMRTSYAVF